MGGKGKQICVQKHSVTNILGVLMLPRFALNLIYGQDFSLNPDPPLAIASQVQGSGACTTTEVFVSKS